MEAATPPTSIEPRRYAADVAAAAGARLIINESFSDAYAYTRADLEALDYAYGGQALIVKSSGNGFKDHVGDANVRWQAAGYQVVVGASDMADRKTQFSNFGIDTDLLAPGDDILTTSFQVSSTTNPNNPATFQPDFDAVKGTVSRRGLRPAWPD